MKTETKKKSESKEHCCENPHTISWFEIAAKDINRAVKFYSTVLGKKIEVNQWAGFEMGIFPGGGEGVVHGAIVKGEGYEPSEKGTIVYLNGGEDLNAPLKKVEPAGGKVLKPKFSIGEHGHIAFFKDTEGNKVALHSPH